MEKKSDLGTEAGYPCEDKFRQPQIVGDGIYQRCPGCGDIVKLNKFILGSIHVCA